MEWVETTGKTVDAAKELALDRLGVAEDEAEFEVLDEAKSGLFGLARRDARVRARIRPTAVRPKQDRRNRGRTKSERPVTTDATTSADVAADVTGDATADVAVSAASDSSAASGTQQGRPRPRRERRPRTSTSATSETSHQRSNNSREATVTEPKQGEEPTPSVAPDEVGRAAVTFMTGLTEAFGASAEAMVHVDGNDLDVQVTGDDLGLLIGPGGRTLGAIQDLVRVASQRRLGDHDTRLRIDIAGYRERRKAALEKFALAVAEQVVESGTAKALEPMSSSDRKVVHDTIIGVEGVTSRSEGDDPVRRVVIVPT